MPPRGAITGLFMGYPESFNELEAWRSELRRSLAGAELIRAIEERIARETDPERRHILEHLLLQEHVAQGNSAAVEAIRARDPMREIHRWRDEWRESHRELDIVPALEERIRTEQHAGRLRALRALLAQEHRDRGDYIAAEAVYLADAETGHDRWRPLISLANQKLYDEDRPEEAMPIIDRAVAVAMGAGLFRREALGVKARIAAELEDYAAVENVLRQIMTLAFTRGNADVGAERDFLDRLPPGSIDPEVARAYDEYCRARGRRPTAADEQIDAFILSSARAQWLKVARIIADVRKQCERSELAAEEHYVSSRIRVMAADGRLEGRGNLAQWRFSEVRLPDSASPPGLEASDEASPGRMEAAVIAGRTLTLKVGRRAVDVPVMIYAPVDKGDHWRCAFEIGWPDEPKQGEGNGIDAVQALMTALKFVGAELYTSKAHKAGKLKCPGQRAGYGFPLPWTLRDLAEEEDRFL
jgi:hypothetical protein